ncbi:MAG: 2-amino-4-hydroxy-6-hydroxymethyldihydropteridine pyrophosphokinae [Frankiales bacterium]|nr:2-amino-4-hydroxy-6-hydroxymethyldihydropteridine pyrophosphokinae [Frankiales bacterium]
MTVRAVLAAGSNLGDRQATLAQGLALLAVHPQLSIVAVSPVYETDPVGGPAQDDYLNLVALADTDLAPRALLGLLHVVEAAADRERHVRWGPRTLDLDLITYGDLISPDADLTLPHPRAHERAFVLQPWADVDEEADLPGHGRVRDLLATLDVSGVRRRPDLEVTA